MESLSDTLEQRMDAFLEACTRRGVRLTHQRIEIYRELARSEDHPDAETLHREVQERIPTLSLDTVYRNLKMLAHRGLISIVGMSHERLRFDARVENHHHFICVKCGMTRDFDSEALGALKAPKEAAAFGTPLSVHMEVKGVCAACQAASRNDR